MSKQLHVFHSGDKSWMEPMQKTIDNPANIPRGSRVLVIGKPHSGKTNLIKNIIVFQEPEFQRIIICREDETSIEYDDVDGEYMNISDLPEAEDLTSDCKTLIILEDINFKSFKQPELDKLSKYMKYVCSHKGVTLLIATQYMFSVYPEFREKADMLILFKLPKSSMSTIASRCDCTPKEFREIFTKNIRDAHDCIVIDYTGSPYLIRRNLFDIIKTT